VKAKISVSATGTGAWAILWQSGYQVSARCSIVSHRRMCDCAFLTNNKRRSPYSQLNEHCIIIDLMFGSPETKWAPHHQLLNTVENAVAVRMPIELQIISCYAQNGNEILTLWCGGLRIKWAVYSSSAVSRSIKISYLPYGVAVCLPSELQLISC
jgi:hypothetical protein